MACMVVHGSWHGSLEYLCFCERKFEGAGDLVLKTINPKRYAAGAMGSCSGIAAVSMRTHASKKCGPGPARLVDARGLLNGRMAWHRVNNGQDVIRSLGGKDSSLDGDVLDRSVVRHEEKLDGHHPSHLHQRVHESCACTWKHAHVRRSMKQTRR